MDDPAAPQNGIDNMTTERAQQRCHCYPVYGNCHTDLWEKMQKSHFQATCTYWWHWCTLSLALGLHCKTVDTQLMQPSACLYTPQLLVLIVPTHGSVARLNEPEYLVTYRNAIFAIDCFPS